MNHPPPPCEEREQPPFWLTPLSAGFLIVFGLTSLALLALPRRHAVSPLVAGVCYLGLADGIELGAFHFTAMRLIILMGVLRVVIRGEKLPGGLIGLDWTVILWAVWALLSSRFHNDPGGDLVFKLGNVYNNCGLYFLCRIFIVRFSDLAGACKGIVLALVPIAAGMLHEQFTMRNLFALITKVSDIAMIRGGKIRAFGPFAHPILAGTVGATVLPLMIGMWGRHKITAMTGMLSCLVVIFASGSSGPVMSAVGGLVGLCVWPLRRYLGFIRWAAVAVYIFLEMVMKVPAYFLIARVDLTGSSTGWHRAALIESSVKHLNEWWFAGTDFTRHWMPTGVSWNPNHTDITNHYLQMGVLGGLPLMFLMIASIVFGFIYVGRRTKPANGVAKQDRFLVWGFGASLFGLAATCISVSFFDQSVLFFYLILAAIASTCYRPLPAAEATKPGSPAGNRRAPAKAVCWGAGVHA